MYSFILVFSLLLFFDSSLAFRYLHSFPTRRSSDLLSEDDGLLAPLSSSSAARPSRSMVLEILGHSSSKNLDRKSTRLNSSHRTISYAVFCLKKKKKH